MGGEIAALIRAERMRTRLWQRDLADRSGIPQPSISAIERGRQVPTQATRARLLGAMAERPSVRLERQRDLVRRILADLGATDLRVFGSVARGEDELGSDLDLLVHLPRPMGLVRLYDLVEHLEDALGVPVDVVLDNAPADALTRALRDAVRDRDDVGRYGPVPHGEPGTQRPRSHDLGRSLALLVETAQRAARVVAPGLDAYLEASEIGEPRRLSGHMVVIEVGTVVERLPDDFKQSRPDVPWRQITGMRTMAAHTYDRVDDRQVFDTLATDLPDLVRLLGLG